MKKSFMILMISGMFIGAAQADLITEYNNGLDEWEKVYPVIKELRQQPVFYGKSREVIGRLKEDPDATPSLVLRHVIKETIPYFLQHNGHFSLVEGLDPVYRDLCGIPALVPLLPTKNKNPYEVKHVFTKPSIKKEHVFTKPSIKKEVNNSNR